MTNWAIPYLMKQAANPINKLIALVGGKNAIRANPNLLDRYLARPSATATAARIAPLNPTQSISKYVEQRLNTRARQFDPAQTATMMNSTNQTANSLPVKSKAALQRQTQLRTTANAKPGSYSPIHDRNERLLDNRAQNLEYGAGTVRPAPREAPISVPSPIAGGHSNTRGLIAPNTRYNPGDPVWRGVKPESLFLGTGENVFASGTPYTPLTYAYNKLGVPGYVMQINPQNQKLLFTPHVASTDRRERLTRTLAGDTRGYTPLSKNTQFETVLPQFNPQADVPQLFQPAQRQQPGDVIKPLSMRRLVMRDTGEPATPAKMYAASPRGDALQTAIKTDPEYLGRTAYAQ